MTKHRKCPIFIIFLRRNIDKNSIQLISKCGKTRLHQCRIKNWHPGPSLQGGEGHGRGRRNGRERRIEAGRWKATGIAHPLISAKVACDLLLTAITHTEIMCALYKTNTQFNKKTKLWKQNGRCLDDVTTAIVRMLNLFYFHILFLFLLVLKHDFYRMLWFYPYRSFKHSKWWCHKLGHT